MMHKSSYIVLKSILIENNNFNRLSKYLDRLELEKVNSCDVSEKFSYNNFLTENILEYIHYSWLIPTFNNLKQDLAICLSSLSDKVQSKLRSQLNISSPTVAITGSAREYINLIFLSSLLGEEDTILPIQYLPYSPMNILAKQSKEDLIKVIDHLAFFDLSAELRKTLNTNTIKKIYSFLNEGEIKFLKKIHSFKDPVSFSSLLDKWDGSKESFRKILHKKGLYRFGLALSGSHPDLIWYICHLLDIGRGTSLMKMCEKKINPVISDTMQAHILEILKNL